jgi:hypothetical protein
MSFDWKKPYRAKNPTVLVEIFCERDSVLWGRYMEQAIGHKWVPTSWTTDGIPVNAGFWLENQPEKRWVNIFRRGFCEFYSTKEQADAHAEKVVNGYKRIACVEIDWPDE